MYQQLEILPSEEWHSKLITIIILRENGGKEIQKDTEGLEGRKKGGENEDVKEMIVIWISAVITEEDHEN
jgi:hypothetical protein